MSTSTPVNTNAADWLTEEDLAWRPDIEARRLNWKELKRLQKYEKKLPSQQIDEHIGPSQQQLMLDDVNEQLMRQCFAMM